MAKELFVKEAVFTYERYGKFTSFYSCKFAKFDFMKI